MNKCNQCVAVTVGGILCHEEDCPNTPEPTLEDIPPVCSACDGQGQLVGDNHGPYLCQKCNGEGYA